MWFTILIIAIVIGGIIGAITSNDDEKGAGCLTGAAAGGVGWGYVLFHILIFGLIIMAFIWLFGALFG